MKVILKKEIIAFFSSSVGYLIICLFLMLNSCFMWIINSDFNILDYGYANIDTFFLFAPIILLVFIPAIGMRMFVDEFKLGTIEILQTKPISNLHIVIGKYLATLILILLSLIPTILYPCTVYYLSEPLGNIDLAGIIGSYFGLFMLSTCFAAISIYCSSLTKNQIVAFLSSIIICSIFYFGFDILSQLNSLQQIDLLLQKIGISYHYQLMSKGVLSSEDLIYFISISIIFIELTTLKINKTRVDA